MPHSPRTVSPRLIKPVGLHLDGEHEQALFLLAHLLEIAPLHPEATHLSADCRAALERECLSSVGSESAILVAAVSPRS